MTQLSRKDFLITSFAAAGAALGLGGSTAGCGGDDDSGGGGSGTKTCKSTSISDNHGHALTVPAADLELTNDKTYSIKGGSGHDHSVTLVASDFAKLKAGSSVIVTASLAAGHVHEVTVTCS